MRNPFALSLCLIITLLSSGKVHAAADTDQAIDAIDVVWDSPSEDSNGSMPMGNGEVGINLWCESDGTLTFYVSRTDALSESARLLKVGQVTMKLSPNPFAEGQPFKQHLKLREGVCEVTAGEGDRQVKLTVLIDVDHPVIFVKGESASPINVELTTPSWRERWQDLRKSIECKESAYTMWRAPFPVIESADVFKKVGDNSIAWYHRNESDIAFTSTMKLQQLEEYSDKAPNLIKNRTFGGWVTADGFTASDERTLKTTRPTRTFVVRIATPAGQPDTAQQWLDEAKSIAKKSSDVQDAISRNEKWWNAFWDRSWIIIDDNPNHDDGKATVHTRGYMLQRYMNAIGGRGNLPIKFNGSIFTVEPTDHQEPLSPDYRRWGDTHWWQNIRFPYHSMLASGDFNMMHPMFEMYESIRPIGEARAKKYFDAEGFHLPETHTVWGMYSNWNYGWRHRDARKIYDLDVHTGKIWQPGLELVCLMLDYYDYTGDEDFLKQRVLPMAESVLLFFDTRFEKNENGQIIIHPTQAVETLQHQVTNDTPTVGGLVAVAQRLDALPDNLLTSKQRAFFKHMKKASPPVPYEQDELNGETVTAIAPAASYDPGRSNQENPELYAVWPYRLYGLGKPKLQEAINAYRTRHHTHLATGWGYDGVVATNLGLTDEAKRIYDIQVRNSNGRYRWPATWGPNFDWHPDQCHGGNLMLTGQYMLLQADHEKIHLLPAWPKEWNVSFKLHAPGNTIVECVYESGKLQKLDVTPQSRRKDIVLPDWVVQD